MYRCDANGNTFLILENNDSIDNKREWIQKNHIKEDGVIFVHGYGIEFSMEYYNKDGSFALLCGNGARSVIKYLYQREYITTDQWITLTSKNISLKGKITSDEKSLILVKEPTFCSIYRIGNQKIDVLKVGVKHAFLELSSKYQFKHFKLKTLFLNVRSIAKEIESTNVSVFFRDKDKILLRTFENGVNRETQSCGTACIGITYLVRNRVKEKINHWKISTLGGLIDTGYQNNKYYLKGMVKCDEII